MIDTMTFKHAREVLVEWAEASHYVRSADVRVGNRDILSISVVTETIGRARNIPGEIRALLELPMTIRLEQPD